jgi:hypothetical protein
MVHADLQYWANVSQIAGAAGLILAAIGLWVAWLQLRKAQKATRGQMLFTIDEALARYEDVRAQARSLNWAPPPNEASGRRERRMRHRVKQYMGVFERIERLIVDGSIDVDTVNALYGQRAQFVMRNSVVQDYVKDRPADWQTFVEFARRLGKVRDDIPEALTQPSEGSTPRRSLSRTGHGV